MPDLYQKVIVTSCIRMLFTKPEIGRKLLAMPIKEDPTLGVSIAIEEDEIRFSREYLKASTNDELFEALRAAMEESDVEPRIGPSN